MTKQERLGLIYFCVSEMIDTYTKEMIIQDGVKYAQLNILLSDIKKEIKNDC